MMGAYNGLIRGDRRPAWLYYRFVAQRRGQAVADEARATLLEYVAKRAFDPKTKNQPPAWRPPPLKKPGPLAGLLAKRAP